MLNWGASADPVLGYHVYRATSPAGPFSRLTSTWVAGNTYLDNGVTQNTYTYMVRSVTLQTNPSGSYYNLSEGALATVTYAPLPASINVTISMATGAPTLTWNSISGAVYHVISATNMMQSAWLNVSGPLTAAGANTTWTLSLIHI